MSDLKPVRMDDDTVEYGRPLRERYEDFCGHFVVSRNPMQAYRLAFVVDKARTAMWVHRKAAELMKDPAIMARVQEMRDAAASQTITSVQEIIQDLHDIATADPNELVSTVHDSCRHCHGIDFAYQWKSEAEYARELERVMRAPVPQGQLPPPLPTCEGGFGYHPHNEPNPMCPECFGVGNPREIIHDTTRVSAKARKLYAGMKKGDVVMHDQLKAREMLGRVLGAFKDGIPLTPTAPNAQPIGKDMDEAAAGRAYLSVITGGKG